MKQGSQTRLTVIVTAVAVVIGGFFAAEWRETEMLRTELLQARAANEEWRRLQAEHERLHAQQISAEELARLRADHAALPRLRAELEALRKRSAAPR